MVCMLVFLLVAMQLTMAVVAQNQFTAKVIISSGNNQCPPQKEIRAALEETTNEIRNNLQLYSVLNQCGDGLWFRVVYLNMSDPSQQCPSAWREYAFDGIRVCARPTSSGASCPGTLFNVSCQYSKVCGRAIGYQFGSTDAFRHTGGIQVTIDQPYLDGISITHGTPDRTHIWSYAAGASENGSCTYFNCPCSSGTQPPSYVGNNYYCESAFQGDCFVTNRFFPNDPLWDGQQCDNEGTCCTGTNTPPWFSVELPDSTSNDIEVRICHNQDTIDEDSPIQLLELYVQ